MLGREFVTSAMCGVDVNSLRGHFLKCLPETQPRCRYFASSCHRRIHTLWSLGTQPKYRWEYIAREASDRMPPAPIQPPASGAIFCCSERKDYD